MGLDAAVGVPVDRGTARQDLWRRACSWPLGRISASLPPITKWPVMEMKMGHRAGLGGMVLLPKLVRGDVLRLFDYTAQPSGQNRPNAGG